MYSCGRRGVDRVRGGYGDFTVGRCDFALQGAAVASAFDLDAIQLAGQFADRKSDQPGAVFRRVQVALAGAGSSLNSCHN